MTPERKEEIVGEWLRDRAEADYYSRLSIREARKVIHELLAALGELEAKTNRENCARDVVEAVRMFGSKTHFQMDYPEIVDALERYDEREKK